MTFSEISFIIWSVQVYKGEINWLEVSWRIQMYLIEIIIIIKNKDMKEDKNYSPRHLNFACQAYQAFKFNSCEYYLIWKKFDSRYLVNFFFTNSRSWKPN